MTPPFYVIAIFDTDDPHGTTVHSFVESALWEWLNRPEPFEVDQAIRQVNVPFVEQSLEVTRWNPRLDKAQGLGLMRHPLVTQHLLGRQDSAHFAAAYSVLVTRAGTSHVFEGTW